MFPLFKPACALIIVQLRALLVNCAQANSATVGPNSRRKVKFYDLRRPNMSALAQALNCFDWSCITQSDDIDFAYENFISITTTLINNNIPQSYLTITDNTPTYITPLTKSLLRKRNKLMRKGRIADARSLSVKIGKLISDTRAQHLSKVTHKDVKKLWSSVRSNTASRKRNCFSACTFTSEDLATHFATIATDVTYDETVINDIITSVSSKIHSQAQQHLPSCKVFEDEVFKSLYNQ